MKFKEEAKKPPFVPFVAQVEVKPFVAQVEVKPRQKKRARKAPSSMSESSRKPRSVVQKKILDVPQIDYRAKNAGGATYSQKRKRWHCNVRPPDLQENYKTTDNPAVVISGVAKKTFFNKNKARKAQGPWSHFEENLL